MSGEPLDFPRLALSEEEAAASLGICEKTLRRILPQLRHFHVGRRVLLPDEDEDSLATPRSPIMHIDRGLKKIR